MYMVYNMLNMYSSTRTCGGMTMYRMNRVFARKPATCKTHKYVRAEDTGTGMIYMCYIRRYGCLSPSGYCTRTSTVRCQSYFLSFLE